MREYILLLLVAAMLLSACATRRSAPEDATCVPMDVLLPVGDGMVEISCVPAQGHFDVFRCEIEGVSANIGSKSGLFGFMDGLPRDPFDPTDTGQYKHWDGCTIWLQNGLRLEEIEIISTGARRPGDFTK
jgi:hypothetical protein